MSYNKILIIIGPAIGDCLLSVPFINGMRNTYPNAEIDTLALVNRAAPGLSEGFQIIKKYCGHINNMLEIEENTNVLRKGAIFVELIKKQYDLVCDLWPATGKKTFFVNAITQGKTAGFTKKHDIYIIPNKTDHKCVMEAKLLSKITGKKYDGMILYPGFRVQGNKYNVVTVSVSRDDDPLRSWPIERWAEILKKIHKEYKMDIMFIGAQVNKGRILDIFKLLDFKPIISLDELNKIPMYISKAKLHLSENGGLMHIATTTLAPVISISQSEPGWAPYGNHNTEIRKKKMKDIKVSELWKIIQKKLKQ
jgi:ADP-heptose:LPS heptosyltransferase